VSDRPSYVLTLQPLPPVFGEPEPEYRLRRALKCLLRSFRLRCTRIEPATPDGGFSNGIELNGDGKGNER
jgi:hypothetical protein